MTIPSPDAQTVVFLHGIGAGPQAWRSQVSGLPRGFAGHAPELPGLADPGSFTLDGAARGVLELADGLGADRLHVCGLSLGAMVAMRFAVLFPQRCASLVIAAGQVRANPALMRVQSAVMRALPARAFASSGLAKADLLAVLRTVGSVDLRADLAQIAAPTLVLCGSRDRANLGAARLIAEGIGGARLHLIPGAGHQANTDAPEEFTAAIGSFYAGLPTDR